LTEAELKEFITRYGKLPFAPRIRYLTAPIYKRSFTDLTPATEADTDRLSLLPDEVLLILLEIPPSDLGRLCVANKRF
jgi:hypothetical protein